MKHNKYDISLNKIQKKYNLYSVLHHPYIPYMYMKRKAMDELKKYYLGCIKEYGEEGCILLHDDTYSGTIFSGRKMDCSHLKELTDEELRLYLESNIGKETRCVISILKYSQNLRISMILLPMDVYEYRDIYYYLDEMGIHTCRSNVINPRGHNWKAIKLKMQDIIHYYGYHFYVLRALLQGNVYFHLFFSARNTIFREQTVTCESLCRGRHSDREYALRRYAATLIDIRDFKTLLDVLEDSSKYGWEENLKADIGALLDALKDRISKRQGRCVILNWIDNLPYNGVDDMPWLRGMRDNGLNFSEAYTGAPWTSMACKVLFSGERAIKDRLFLRGRLGEDNYRWFDEIAGRGFKFYYLGEMHKGDKLFMRKNRIMYGEHRVYFTSSERQWQAICLMAKSNRNLFLYIHDLYECHLPFYSITYDGMTELEFSDEYSIGQKIEARHYLDGVLEWYEGFYGDALDIYFSDHGDRTLPAGNYSSEITHTIFFVRKQGEGAIAYNEKKMLSMVNMGELIIRLMDGDRYDDLLGDEVYIDNYDVYGVKEVARAIEDSEDKEKWMQNQAIRTDHDLYVLYADGTNKYYVLPDEKNDLSNDERYADRIKEQREKLERNFININEYKMFTNSRKLYEHFNVGAT